MSKLAYDSEAMEPLWQDPDRSGDCEVCDRPEAQHVWLTRRQLEVWRPEPGEFKTWCEIRTPSAMSDGETEFKVYSEAKAPVDPCDSEFMEEIST